MPMVDDDLLGPSWDEPEVVRRAPVLPREVERALAESAQERGVRPHTLPRQLVVEGLARLAAEGSRGSKGGSEETNGEDG